MLLAGCGAPSIASESGPGSAPTSSPTSPHVGGGKGNPPQVSDFPTAPNQLAFSGAFTASTTSGRPFSCGAGTGPDGIQLFEFGVYLDLPPGTEALVFDVKPYGTSPAATADAYIAAAHQDRSLTKRFVGQYQVTVARASQTYSGTVSGTLPSITGSGLPETVTGSWTCTPGPLLGPG